jgi:hypothetical protein
VGLSFLCASGALHSTVTVLPGDTVPLITFVVVAVRLILHVPDAQGNNISDPHCSTIWLLSVDGATVPVIWSVCPSAVLPQIHPAMSAPVKIFVFMSPLNSQRQHDCKLLLGRSLGGIEL